jgi:hypothetical protein
MSFSSDIKQELNKNSNLSNKEIVKNELIGYFISGNTNIVNNKEIKFSTESDYNINRFSKLLTNLNINHKIDISGKTFVISLKIKDINFISIQDGQVYLELVQDLKEENLKAIIRGAFMGSGSINNPEKEYHLEVDMSNKQNLDKMVKMLQQLGIRVKTFQLAIYIKEGEEISKFLALIGASKAVMQFEDIRIQKEMRGKVNRLVNCETANLNKTINASIQQIAAIRKLQETGKFNKLDDNLKEIATLRLENPDMPLVELGKLLKNPVGKSGVNYRLKKIMEIADGE